MRQLFLDFSNRFRAELRERHVQFVGDIDQQLSKSAGIENGTEPTRTCVPAMTEQHCSRHELVDSVDRQRAVALQNRLEGSAATGDCAGMSLRKGGTLLRFADLAHHNRDVVGSCSFQRAYEPCRISDRLDEHRYHMGCRHLHRIVQEGIDASGDLGAHGDYQVESVPRVGHGEHREHRA